MSIRNVFVTMAFALFAAGIGADAGAQQRREGPCAADAKKFCGDVKPGQGAIAKCMKAHEAELSRRVQKALMGMGVDDRVVLTLRHFADLSYREIGVILGLEDKTVKSRLFEARQRLRGLLADLRTA